MAIAVGMTIVSYTIKDVSDDQGYLKAIGAKRPSHPPPQPLPCALGVSPRAFLVPFAFLIGDGGAGILYLGGVPTQSAPNT